MFQSISDAGLEQLACKGANAEVALECSQNLRENMSHCSQLQSVLSTGVRNVCEPVMGSPPQVPAKPAPHVKPTGHLVQQIFEQLCRAQTYADKMLNAMLAGLQEVDRPVLASPVWISTVLKYFVQSRACPVPHSFMHLDHTKSFRPSAY